jgi:phosphoglycerol transferase MdoB-like AlkP superfamily enzyme
VSVARSEHRGATGEFLWRARSIVLLGIVFLGIMSLFRLFFLLRFGVAADLRGLERDVLKAFWLGVRFDLQVVCYMSACPFLVLLLGAAMRRAGLWNLLTRAFRLYYTVTFCALSLVLAADLGFYSYFQDHINVVIYGLWEDDPQQLFQMVRLNYNLPLAIALTLLYFAAAWLLVRRCTRPAPSPGDPGRAPTTSRMIVTGGVLFVGLALGCRGSLGVFPLGLKASAISSSQFVNQLSANGVLSLSKSFHLRHETHRGELDLIAKMGFKSAAQAFALHYGVSEASLRGRDLTELLAHRTPADPAVAARKPNVVVVLVEALGSHWMRFQSGRFDLLGKLKQHFAQDFVFWHFLPSDNGTIGSLLSLVLNMPQRPMFPFLTESEYMRTTFDSSAFFPFAKNGYETMFVYGGQTSWRDTNQFIARQGCEKIVGAADIEAEEKRPDGEPLSQPGIWKVYDEYVYRYIERRLNDGGRPKFIVALTTTNHPPYSVPKHYRPRPLEVPPELEKRMTGSADLVQGRFLAYQYTCAELAEFLDNVKNSPLGENTIVAVVGDHNFWGVVRYESGEVLEKYGVPFYLYVPPAWRPERADTGAFGSHLDIMPTLYPLALSDTSYVALGRNLLEGAGENYATNTAFISVSHSGGMVENRFGKWGLDGDLAFDEIPDAEEERARAYFRSLLAVTDHYVKSRKGKGDESAAGGNPRAIR